MTSVQNLQILNQLYRQSGGGVNLQQYLAIYEHLEGMKASDYPCTQEELIKIESRLREQLGNLVVDCALATTVEEQIQILRNYLEAQSDRELLGLLEGRYQFLRLQIPLNGKMVTIDITTRNADGTVSSEVLVRQGSKVQTLESFMVANHIASVPALLAMSTTYQMIDPVRSNSASNNDILGSKAQLIEQGVKNRPNPPAWRNMVKSIKNAEKGCYRFRVKTLQDALDLLEQANPEILKNPKETYYSDIENYLIGYEIHDLTNIHITSYIREIDANNDMSHLKFLFWINGKRLGYEGHIFYGNVIKR